MESEGPKRLQLSATGPGDERERPVPRTGLRIGGGPHLFITAGQIATTGDIEVMNPYPSFSEI